MKILLSEKQKGIVSIIAAVVINLVLGSFYLWGSINIYVASYYKINYDPELQTDITSMCFPIMAVACNGVVPISLKICEKLGIRLHCFIFSVFFSVCVFVSSYMTSFWYFVLLYGVGFGFGSGMIYLIPLYNCYKFFPNKRGLISGIIMGGYGVGSLISSNIFLTLVNPDNKKPGEDHYFSAEIANNVPKSLRIIAIFFFGLMVIGIIFLFEFPMTPEELEKENEEENQQSKIIEKVEEEEEEEPAKIVLKLVEEPSYEKQDNNQIKSINADLKEKLISSHGKKISIKNSNDGLFIPKKASMFHSSIAKWSPRTINPKDDKECPDLYHALKSLPFYIIFLMLFFSAQNGYFLAANFKNYGILKPDLNDDVFLTLVGSLSSIFNGGGRLLWGYILDKFGFKKVNEQIHFCFYFMQFINMISKNV